MTNDKIVNGKLITDLDESLLDKEVVTYARNSNLSTFSGNSYLRTQESSTLECFTAPYPILHLQKLKGSRVLVFSTDNINSELGIADENTCSYSTLISNQCLGFDLDFPISSTFKENDLGEELVVFSADNFPVRVINLQNIPFTYTIQDDVCETKEFTNDLDCDALLLFKKISVPSLNANKGFGGVLPNGMYSVAMAYTVEGQKYSDYYGLTTPVPIYNESGSSSLEVKISNMDKDFDAFDLIVIYTVKGVTTAKKIGNYPTSIESIQITDVDKPEYVTIPLETVVITKKIYERVGFIANNSEYLILADLTSKPIINLQRQVQEVEAEYVVIQKPLDYYRNDGKDVGHYRDEVYAYFIRYLYDTGDYTSDAHLYGRKAKANEKALASGFDVYETSDSNFQDKMEVWQVKNTAGKLILENNPFVNDSRILGHGEFGYWESTEKYEDNVELHGENACTPIRHFKFPDESIVPRYSKIEDKIYINILGIRFKNIPYPVDEQGNPIKGIIGYEILRATRSGGNRSVVARGIMTNARGYKETQGQQLDVVYASYGVNNTGPDNFLSLEQTKNQSNRERNFKPLTTVYKDKFNFYTPHAYFNNKYRMGNEFVIETEEVADVEGYFEPVVNHPKDYLLTNFSLYLALLMGAIQGFLATSPKYTRNQKITTSTRVGLDAGVETSIEEESSVQDNIGFTNIFTNPANLPKNATQIVKKILQTIAKAGMFVFFAAEFAYNALRIIKNFSQLKNYALQYNGVARFTRQLPVREGNKRRRTIRQPEYLSPNLHTIGNLTINNFDRPTNIFVELSKEIPLPSTKDTSCRTMTEARVGVSEKFTSIGSAYYATSKIKNPSQYGQLGTVRKVKTSNEIYPITANKNNLGLYQTFTSPVLFGGDCIIAEFSVLNKLPFFTQDLSNSNLPDGNIQYDYRMYRNLAYPRFWADFSDYELGNLITSNPSLGRLPSNKHNLDNRGNADSNNAFTVEDRYFYLYHNTALNFIAEADYNIAFREKTEIPYYSSNSSNLSLIFNSKNVRKPEEFKLDPSFEKLEAIEFYSETIKQNYSSLKNRKRDRNALIYSLPSFKGQNIDNWLYFLPGNYFSFNNTDFGNLTGIHKLDQDKIIFLFDKASPYISMGRDQLETVDGRKITIGDGGLFAQQPRELIHTDVYYGASQSKYAFVSTPFGSFYPSARQGRMFKLAGNLEDISRNGMHFWCKNFMPLKLLEFFPNYNLKDNPVNGVGYLTVFDSKLELIYIIKRDFIPQPNLASDITFDEEKGKFFFRGYEVSLRDNNYFKDISWTLSYSPSLNGFNSWHDWHPDNVLQTENHFISIKGNKAWKHNERVDDFCTFYNTPHDFQIGLGINTGKEVHILSSLEYVLEGRVFRNNKIDSYHSLNANFDNLVIFNSEQHSGVLNLVQKPINPFEADTYPKFNNITGGIDTLYSKEENRYRINQFQDLVKDRGEFYPFNEIPLWLTEENGYVRNINVPAIDYNKPVEQRKKFRHYLNQVLFSKKGSTKYQLVFKFLSAKIKNSPR